MQVRELLRDNPRNVAAVEGALDYRMDRHHVGLVLWTDTPNDPNGLLEMRRLVSSVGRVVSASGSLVVPLDESMAWAWVSTSSGLARSEALATLMKESHLSLAVGQPGLGMEGFRRTHHQAVSAHAVALAAGDQHAPLTAFVDVAPIAMLCTDLESARAWVHETLGDLAVQSGRNEALRDTARTFLQTGGSYTATSEQLFLHRNTVQYRIRKAEEIRGRPLRECRLDVELALVACHWMKNAVLWSDNA
jgi:DNA-binding PucR family transcriptional regulator